MPLQVSVAPNHIKGEEVVDIPTRKDDEELLPKRNGMIMPDPNEMIRVLKRYEASSLMRIFRGVYTLSDFVVDKNGAASRFLDLNAKNVYFIYCENKSDPRNAPHWVGVFVYPSRGVGYFIDSFDQAPGIYSSNLHGAIQRLVLGGGGEGADSKRTDFYTLPYRVQSENVALCGFYCIYLAKKFQNSYPEFSSAIETRKSLTSYGFHSKEYQKNDQVLVKYIQRIYHLGDNLSTCIVRNYRNTHDKCLSLESMLKNWIE
jgi:hypothetical protein